MSSPSSLPAAAGLGSASGAPNLPASFAGDLVSLMDALGHQRFAAYVTDTGMTIAHALAADHPGHVERIVVSEAPLRA
jgi:pimeloyl-ACP methyl ester carboxylesterase